MIWQGGRMFGVVKEHPLETEDPFWLLRNGFLMANLHKSIILCP
jgi:hypothetical protein